jgi:hypothetical protein
MNPNSYQEWIAMRIIGILQIAIGVIFLIIALQGVK